MKITVTKRVASQLHDVAAMTGKMEEKVAAYRSKYGGVHYNNKQLTSILSGIENKTLEITETYDRSPLRRVKGKKLKVVKKVAKAPRMSAKAIASVKKAEKTRRINKKMNHRGAEEQVELLPLTIKEIDTFQKRVEFTMPGRVLVFGAGGFQMPAGIQQSFAELGV